MKILNKLTLKHLLMNKKRTIVTIIGVILSTSLMVGIGLIVSSFRDSMIKDTIYYNGSQHVTITNLNESQASELEKNYNIKEYDKLGYVEHGYYDYEKNIFKPEIYTIDKKYLEKFKYTGSLPSNNNEIIVSKSLKKEIGEEILVNSKTYKVVGIYTDISKSGLSYSFSDSIFTIDGITDEYIYLIKFKNPKKTYDYIEDISSSLKIDDDSIVVNKSLLTYYGAVKYSNIMDTMTNIICIVLGLISLACIIVIYNSFAISVMERKKQFGLFSSIGTTKSQLIKTVYFEALIVSIIGIPLGILAAYLGIGVVIAITNNLLSFGENVLELSTYPLFIIIPIIFMIITIVISAFIPSIKASRISPIEAIRLNDDIKIKSKKVRTPKFIRKIFGIEGELALKNIKRNRKKYSVTIISLFISTVLFITFSSFINYVIGGVKYLSTAPEVDVLVEGKITDDDKKYIVSNEDIDNYAFISHISLSFNNEPIEIYVLEDEYYNNLLKKLGKKERKPIVPNLYKGIEYDNDKKTRVVKPIKKFNKVETIKGTTFTLNGDYNYEFNDYYLVDEVDDLLDSFKSEYVYLFATKDMIEKYEDTTPNKLLLIKTKNDVEVTKYIKERFDIEENNNYSDINNVSVDNVAEAFRLEKNVIIVIKIFVYGFISLVTLIGITSVINTINTSIALRRKEFAVLRSIGLTRKGFNKMIYFESLFFGLKSLILSLPVSGIIIYLIHKSVVEVVAFQSIMLPITQMIYAIIGVFIIVLLTMLYASHKIKKDNILEAIREENI